MKKIAFIICCEQGGLEQQSILFARSLREFGGLFNQSDIYSFQPRKGTEVSTNTLNEFRKLNVYHITEKLNEKYTYYPHGNKAIVSAWANKNIDADILVFCDSDTLFLNEPNQVILPDDVHFKGRPVDVRRIGIDQPKGRHYDHYWSLLEKSLGFNLSFDNLIHSSIDNLPMIPYFNAGFYVTSAKSQLFSQWNDIMVHILENEIHHPEFGYFHSDQIAMSLAIQKYNHSFTLLGNNYNAPLHKKNVAFEQPLVHVHYHSLFKNYTSLTNPANTWTDDKEKLNWLNKNLTEVGFLPLNKKVILKNRYRKYYGKIKSRIYQVIKSI